MGINNETVNIAQCILENNATNKSLEIEFLLLSLNEKYPCSTDESKFDMLHAVLK